MYILCNVDERNESCCSNSHTWKQPLPLDDPAESLEGQINAHILHISGDHDFMYITQNIQNVASLIMLISQMTL